jgi:DNA-binding response OmpR family regulator
LRVGVRVLLVEDDLEVAATVRPYLEGAGYEVVCAATAAEARSLLQARPPDVVVTDIALPDGSGVELARDARAQGTPVIALTGGAAPNDEFSFVLEKPCSPRLVLEMVRALVAGPPHHPRSSA